MKYMLNASQTNAMFSIYFDKTKFCMHNHLVIAHGMYIHNIETKRKIK